jgi:cell wall-associated NlpC family hydrolase
MVSKRTRQMGFTAALMLMGSMSVACGAEYVEPGTDEPTVTSESSATPTSTTEADEPTSVMPTEEETGGLAAEGREGADEGLASTLAENAADAEAPAAEQDGEIAQQSEALLSTRGSSLATEARRIANYTNRSTSYYSHTTYMNESTGTRRADCSGLMAYILSRKSPSGYSLIPATEGGVRPVARDIFNYLNGRPTTASTQTSARWRKILKPSLLKAGDLVVYAYSSGQTTGHVMMVKELPYKSSRSGEWIVPVVDSARSGHASDSRGTTYTGPGTGRIGIKVNSDGYPTGYYWKGGVSTTLNTTKIVMGRLE